jgi:2-methylcitrate dehydratase PrpD
MLKIAPTSKAPALQPAPALASTLAAFVADLTPDSLPTAVVDDARWRLIDWLGNCLAGSRLPSSRAVMAVASQIGGRREASMLPSGRLLPATIAGWANAAVAHATDFDDFHGAASVHISSVAVPAAIAMSERQGADGRACLTAMVAGAEIGIRVNLAPAPQRFHARGLHGTGVVGPFAAAAIGARLLGLSSSEITNALGMAGSQSAGLMQGLIDGSWVKQLHPGWGVQAGLTVSLLAQRGFTGPTEVLEGRFGFYNALLHNDESPIRLEQVTNGLGSVWHLPETHFKPYPTGAWNQASIDATLALMKSSSLGVEQAERIDCYVPIPCIGLVCEPRELKVSPQTPYHIKFSLPFSVAIAAIRGHFGVDDLDQATLADRAVRDLATRVFCHPDPSLSIDRLAARVVITTSDGRQLESAVHTLRGGLDHPLTQTQIQDKFLANAEPTLGTGAARRLLATLEDIWGAPSIHATMALAAAGRAGRAMKRGTTG